MKILLLLLCASLAHAQIPEIAIGPGAGKDPLILRSGGNDLFTIYIIVGPGATKGRVLTIDISKGGEVEQVDYDMYENGIFSGRNAFATEREIRLIAQERANLPGTIIECTYRVTRKKLPKA